MVQQTARPGEWVDTALSLADIGADKFGSKVPTDRYTCREFQERERELIWMRSWQIVGRVGELPKSGDWKTYRLFDQSYIIVRGKDGVLRGFVNACRHRGNLICQGEKGNTRRFLCQYHLWSYDLDGKLRGVLREKVQGPIDKDDNSLLQVAVDTFAGFIFLNPDPDAEPLSDYLGEEVVELLAPYRLDEMTTVMDVREALDCNWKVVMDAFQEGYHVSGVHPQLLNQIDIDPTKSRYLFFDEHSVACAPFDVANAENFGPEQHVEGIRGLQETFPSLPMVLPRFDELVAAHRDENGKLEFPEGVTARTILQQATRDTFSGLGMDVSALTDAQMSDNHGWTLFPNFFMTIRAGECHVIMAMPHPSGDPNKCVWHVSSYMWLPEELADQFRAELVDVTEPGSHEYFLALQQDYEQMQRQQAGLRNKRLDHLSLVKEEIVVAHFHSVVDRHLAATARS
ncbi:aromatic ring-hydroxylating dioxygenase subunit alpha [Actinomadura sp. GC306]|uniref:aromatic ring-hydroxylating oxygenase subunit alpha n=1 Tax=Actinomadura sp. GC306 TaxID=2530367 RepID=UPI0010450B35|nr:aromatic ring-hydroxylating dioxygenase subunit alpha [Actinomadura sp. GC306]TDC71820.1 aromatic ring-hydroxylating dioxygenase subunit alpha [Actinomadura sp. GC306]